VTELFSYAFMQRALLAAILGGACCGIVGVWVVMLGIPFVGIAMSHAAFAGAVVGVLLHWHPLVMAMLFCLASAAMVGPVADRGELNPNVSVGILFSLVLGVAFLAMGFIEGPKTVALQLLWGSILTVTARDVWMLGAALALTVLFCGLWYKEIKAVLFDRELARAVGIAEKPVFYMLLLLCGITVSLNLNTIGGLLIFSLIVSPASAAYQLTYRVEWMYAWSILFAVGASLTGLLASYAFDVPSGASIIICASAIFGVCMLFSPKKRLYRT
jgi:manganese/iron transport system permease protein